MKKLATLCTIIGLCSAHVVSADNDKDEGKDKKAPPGLEKKGGVPPGQAKKKGKSGDAAPESTPAAAAPTPAAPTAAPAPAPATTAKPASEPAKPAPTAVKADTAKPVDPKSALDNHTRTINQAAKANEKAALQQISKETGVSILEIQQQQKQHPAASPTALLVGNLIAKKSGKKFDEVLRERQNGKHWADIAKAHNVDINPIVQKASHLAQTLQSAK